MYFKGDQDKAELIQRLLLDSWEAYCDRYWLSKDDNTPYSPEDRIKRFLSDCAYILLRDNPEGTMSHYKEIDRGSHEIPVSSCPAYVQEKLYSGSHSQSDEDLNEKERFNLMLERLDAKEETLGKPKYQKKQKRKETQFQRVERIRTKNPGCTFYFCRVDTENRFEYEGVYYRIDESVEVYQPKQTREGQLFDMDEIVVVRAADGTLHFYDQKMYPLDRKTIRFA